MSMFGSMNISASGLEASRKRMEAVASNLANAESSAPVGGQVYQPRRVKLSEAYESFQNELRWQSRGQGVESETVEENRPARLVHDPGHPDADANGMVRIPDIELTDELAEMMAARRAYDAGLTAYSQARELFLNTLDIIRS